ncbi:hypothetical protein P4O66_013947, partial [Electrophorus voltai]
MQGSSPGSSIASTSQQPGGDVPQKSSYYGPLPAQGDDDDDVSMDTSLAQDQIKYNMRKSVDLDDEGCYLHPGKRECLRECGFNASAKTILIIHGWTIGGVFESWMYQLVAAVRQRELEANLI